MATNKLPSVSLGIAVATVIALRLDRWVVFKEKAAHCGEILGWAMARFRVLVDREWHEMKGCIADT
jgi:hypothetical protein